MLFSKKSCQVKGTLYQLKALLNRTAVPMDPDKNLKAAEDFLTIIMHAYIITAAKKILSKKTILSAADVSKEIVETYLNIKIPTDLEDSTTSETKDKIYLYAREVLTLCLLWQGYHDAISEGDGDRVMRYWRFLLLVFKNAGRKNYSLEALNLLVQDQYLLSPREKAQLRWSRFINTQGRQGCNIPCDLHMEHLNRRLKSIMRNMGANVTDRSISVAAKSIGVVNNICKAFENHVEANSSSDHHPPPCFIRDLNLILVVLNEQDVFSDQGTRKVSGYNKRHGLLEKYNYANIQEWLTLKTHLLVHR